MDLEKQVETNVSDIKELTVQMTRLATIVEQTEKNRATDTLAIHDVAQSMNLLNDKIGNALSMSKDIEAIRATLAERTQELGGVRHDIKNALQALQTIPLLKEKTNEIDKAVGILQTQIGALNTWRDKADGAGDAVKLMASVFWTMFGGLIVAGVIWVVKHFSAGGMAIGGE